MRRWLADRSPWVLAASIGVNLFLVGLIGATVLFGAMRGPSGPPAVQWMMKRAGGDSAPLFEQALAEREVEIKQARAGYRDAKRELRTVLSADVVDPAALSQALAGRTDARTAVHRELNQVFLKVAPNLPKDARIRMMTHAERRTPPR